MPRPPPVTDPVPAGIPSIQQPQDSLGFLFWQVTHGWQRFLEDALAPLGLTHLQFVLLMGTRWLGRTAEPPTQAELARWSKIHPMQISQVVKSLTQKDLVRRRPSQSDSRAWCLELTEAGARTAEAAGPIVQIAHHRFFGDDAAIEAPLRRLLQDMYRRGETRDR